MRPDPGGRFESDLHRRIVASLSIPRSLELLTESLAADPHTWPEQQGPPLSAGEVKDELAELIESGHVQSLGEHDNVKDLVDSVSQDDDVPDLHPEVAENLDNMTRRRRGRRPKYVVEGEQFYMTAVGFETLQAGLPEEPPPLEGDDLEDALERNRDLAEQDEKIIEENKEQLRQDHLETVKELES